jgi:REP element-mobilizing transposase RayT
MGRLPRFDAPGTVFHVMGRGNGGRKIYADSDDLTFFCGWLRKMKSEMGFKVHAYCLMTNHFHLLLETGPESISAIMHKLLTVHARRFNVKSEGSGHLFQGRFKALPCATDHYFAAALRYVHRNPVAAGLVRLPEDWKFSGHRELLGASGQGLIEREATLRQLAPDATLEDYLALFADERKDDALESAAEMLAAAYGLSPDEVRTSKTRLATLARRELLRRAKAQGLSAAEVSRFLGCSESAVSQLAKREPADLSGSLALT